MEPYIELFIGQPIGDPLVLAQALLSGGEISKATSSKIVLKDDGGGKVVFLGDFVIGGEGEITGTMTGFKYKNQGIKLIEGGGYEIDAADLVAGLESGGSLEGDISAVEEPPVSVLDLLLPDNILLKGSKFGDQFNGVNSDGATVRGRDGDDFIIGGEGNQVLKGGKGNDLIGGYAEKDKLFGGKGFDTFLFAAPDSTAPIELEEESAPHKIKDFSHTDDTISVILGKFAPGFLGSEYFKKGTEATTADHRIIYDKDSGKFYYDSDGTGEMEQIHLGSVKAGTKVKADDFFINPGDF